MRIGNKKIYHLEAWVVKVMSIYKVSPWQPFKLGIDSDYRQKQFFLGIELGDLDDFI